MNSCAGYTTGSPSARRPARNLAPVAALKLAGPARYKGQAGVAGSERTMAHDHDRQPTLAAALELMKGRRSVRSFADRPVSDELVEQVLEAARWAPSAGNRAPWRMVLVSERERIRALADKVRARLDAARAGPGWRGGAAGEAYLEHFVRFEGAPRLVAPVVRVGADMLARMAPELQRAGTAPGAREATPGPVLDALSSVAAATLQLMLAAHAAGLGTCWMTGPLVAEPALREELELPRGWHLAALVPLGWPAATPTPPPRRPLGDLVLRR